MARIPQVTRTMQTTKVNALCLNIEEQKPVTLEVTLPRTYKDGKALDKALSASIDTDTLKYVHTVSTEVIETLYGMSEEDFIKYATILPPRAKAETPAEDAE